MTARRFALAAVFAAMVVFPSTADAAPRRFYRRAAAPAVPSPSSLTPVKSDELVQAALANTPSGGVALLPQGTFRTSVVIDRPMTLRANARGTTFDGKGLGVPVVRIAPGVTDVVIEGLRIQNGSAEGVLAAAGADRLSLSRVTVTGCGGDGVRLDDVSGARLDLCVLESNGGDGIDAAGPDLVVARTTARSNAGAAVVAGGLRARITELVVVGGLTGIEFASGAGVAERCRFAETATAVRFATGSWGNRVATCDVRGGTTAVLAEAGSGTAVVTGVVAQGLAGDGLRMVGAAHVVSDCTVSDAGGSGILLVGEDSRATECSVLRVAGEGIRLEGDRHVASGNDVERAATEGIHVAGGRDNEVTGNLVLRCGGRGIADDGEGTRMSRNRMD